MKSTRIQRRRRTRRQRLGATTVEFAIVANVFLLTIFTCIEFARMNMIRNLAQDAAYAAARHVIVPGATRDEAIERADNVMGMMTSHGYVVDVNDIDEDTGEVVVTVSVDFDEVALMAPRFLPNATLETTARMKTERYEGFYEQ